MNTERKQALKRLLLASVRAGGADAPAKGPSIADDRLRAAVRNEGELTIREQRRLLLSPDLQMRVQALRYLERMKTEDAWAEEGWAEHAMSLAAAADAERVVEPLRLTGPHFSADLYPIGADGRVWRIELRVEPAILQRFLALSTTGVRLVDSEDRNWVRGRPNDQGVVIDFWQRDEDLQSLVHRVSFRVRAD